MTVEAPNLSPEQPKQPFKFEDVIDPTTGEIIDEDFARDVKSVQEDVLKDMKPDGRTAEERSRIALRLAIDNRINTRSWWNNRSEQEASAEVNRWREAFPDQA